MTEGIFALAGVVVGAVLGIAGTALTERWRHSYIRNDARTDRQAANMREAQEALSEFVLAWSPVADRVGKGEAVDVLDPAIITGPPGRSHRRLVDAADRVHVGLIRDGLNQLVHQMLTSVIAGKIDQAAVQAFTFLGSELSNAIGIEIRELEAK